jgi:predicted phosphohydrolase
MKLIWCSDIHLNFLEFPARQEFYAKLKESEGETIVISGDIAESHNVVSLLTELKQHSGKKVYFVLGNHDFYGSNIASVKRSVLGLGHLESEWVVQLDASTALVGVDGWGDCRFGDYENSRLTMSDWIYIEDLKGPYYSRTYTDKDILKIKLQQLADLDAAKLKRRVLRALKQPGIKRVIIVTHVPPFKEACLYAGQKSTLGGLPFFASKILGTSLLPIIEANKQVDFLWLSGHTHSSVTVHKRENLVVRVANSQYYFPQIAEVIE